MSDPAPKTIGRVLLIGWDAADWRHIDPLLEAGRMPNLQRFLDEGVRGNIATLQPILSPILWNSIATGKHADQHGVLGFAEIDPHTGKPRPVTSTSRRCKAIWNILHDRGRPSGVVNWYASHPAEQVDGFVVTDRFAMPVGPLNPDAPFDDWPPVPGSVHPAADLEDLCRTRIHPMMITREQVAAFVPCVADDAWLDASRADAELTRHLAELRSLLAHCATVHNAATAYLQEEPWGFLGIYYDAIDRFAHAFMEFAAPKMPHVSPACFEAFSGVMDACYAYHDLMLGRLMGLVGDETAVVIVSDHGFFATGRRPEGTSAISGGQPVSWHRTYGMVAARGPGIKAGQPIYGASLLDICPTVLSMLGEPVADDMAGRVLVQMFDTPPDIRSCVTYENTLKIGKADATTPGDVTSPEDASAQDDPLTDDLMLDQLRRLGYLADAGDDDGVETILIDRHRNLGTVYMTTGRPRLAVHTFRKILRMKPDDKGAAMSIATVLLSKGRHRACETIVRRVLADEPASSRAMHFLGLILRARGEDAAALGQFRQAIALSPKDPALHVQLGSVQAQQEAWAEAEACFRRALEIEPDEADAHDGLGVVLRRTGRVAESVLSHVRSVALLHNRPGAHLNLAAALAAAGQNDWAVDACRVAITLAPDSPDAHRLLAMIATDGKPDPERAAYHTRLADRLSTRRRRRTDQPPTRAGDAATPRERTSPDNAAQYNTGQPSDAPITVVSGLPRSGTSLMMQLLAAGGIAPLTDHERTPDADNPRGYYELEAVKATANDPAWLDDAPGKAVKVIHALLPTLPTDRRYRVVFMTRAVGEVVASQSAMLGRHSQRSAGLPDAQLVTIYERERARVLDWASRQPHLDLHVVHYNTLIDDPGAVLPGLCAFLKLGLEADPAAFAGVIDRTLHRQHSDPSPDTRP